MINDITSDLFESDLRSIFARAHRYRHKIDKEIENEDNTALLTSIFERANVNFHITEKGENFTIPLTNYVSIKGWRYAYKSYIISLEINCGGIKLDSSMIPNTLEYLSCELERFIPMIHQLSKWGEEITSKYDKIIKQKLEGKLLDVMIRGIMEQNSITPVVIRRTSGRKSKVLVEKTIMGVTLQAVFDPEKYEVACSQFIEAVNRFPKGLPQGSKHILEYDPNIHRRSKLHYVAASRLPASFRMVYANGAHDFSSNVPDTPVSEVSAVLKMRGYRCSFEEATSTLVVEVCDNLKLCRIRNRTYYRLITETGEEKDNPHCLIDNETFIKLLNLLAAASQEEGLKVTAKDIVDSNFMSTNALLLDSLFPMEFSLMGERGTSLVFEFNGGNLCWDLVGSISNRIDDLWHLAFDPLKIACIREVWRAERRKSYVKIYVKHPEGFLNLVDNTIVKYLE